MKFLKKLASGLTALAGLGLMLADVSAMGNVNPYFTLKNILPPELSAIAGVGGIDLFANGDGVICTWGGDKKSLGEVWIIPNLASGTPGTPVRISQGLREPLGVKVVGQDIYVMERPRILKYTGSGSNWTKTTHFALPTAWYDEAQWHYFSWGLIHKDSSLWFSTGMAYNPKDDDFRERGALIKVPFDGSGYSQYARGMRNTDGIGQGPEGEIFLTDNEGDWKPANMMYHVPTPKTPPAKQGRFYGYRTSKNNDCGLTPDNVAQDNCPQDPVYPPAVWLPYGNYSNSPTRPILLKAGPYAGQMIFGDVFHGDILRTFVEKVNGEWQGAAFTFMTQTGTTGAGIPFGVHQFIYTPSGSLIATGIGGGGACGGGSGNWAWLNTCRGMNLLTPTTSVPFDILAIRSVKEGFDIEFSEPVAAAAGQASSWSVKTRIYTPVHAYGRDLLDTDNNVTVAVSSAGLSEDGKHVTLKLASLGTKRMYTITASNAVKSASGGDLWTNVGYYTLNSVNPSTTTIRSGPITAFAQRIHASLHAGRVSLDVPLAGRWKIELLRLDGTRISQASGMGPSHYQSQSLPPGLYVIAGRGEGGSFRERIHVQ